LRFAGFTYPVSEKGGAIIHDISGQANHGRIMLSSGTLVAAWAERQDDYHYSLKNGFSKTLYFETGSSSSERVNSGVGIGASEFTAYQLFKPNEWNTSTVAHSYMGSTDYNQNGWRVGSWKNLSFVYIDYETPSGVKYAGTSISISSIPASSVHHMFVRMDATNDYVALNIDDIQRVSSSDLSLFVPTTKEVLFMHGRQGGWTTPGGNLYRCAYWNRKLSDGELEIVRNGYPDDVSNGLIFYRDESRGIVDGTVLGGKDYSLPAQLGSGLDVCNIPLTNPSGDFHNGAITKLQQSEANPLLKVADEGFWYNPDGTAKEIGYAELLTETSDLIASDINEIGAIANVTTMASDTNGATLAQAYLATGQNESALISTTNEQFSVYAENGIRLGVGSNAVVEIVGKLVGDGSGLFNLTATNLLGIISTNNLPPEALQSGGASDWSQLTGIPAAFTDGVDNVLSDADISVLGYVKTDADTQLNESQVDSFVANNGYASVSNTYTSSETDQAISNALANIDAGAITSGTISTNVLPPEALQSGGASDWSQLTGVPAAFTDGVDNVVTVLGTNGIAVEVAGEIVTTSIDTDYLYSTLLANISPMGDLSMGVFTNNPANP